MTPKFFKSAATVAVLAALCSPALAGECYNKVDKRDKWLASWVYWIPAKGEKVELRGKTYSQSKAIAYAKKEIPAGFKKQGGTVDQSATGLAALDMIKAKNNAKRAQKAYEKRKPDIAWDDAIACWTRYKGKV